MNYDLDIVLVFAEKDNQPLHKEEQGWVSQFRKFLEMMLVQLLGVKPRLVLMDEGSDFSTLDISPSSIMILILSKNFMKAGQCLAMAEQFHGQAVSNGAERIFKVLKAPVTQQEQSRTMRGWTGYDLFQTDAETTVVSECIDFFSPEAERQFWMKLVDLTYDIHDSALTSKSNGMAKPAKKGKTIFLAEVGGDLSIQRSIIRRELQRYGYAVLPSHSLPMNINEIEPVLNGHLRDSVMSIHLIGNAYGEVPLGSHQSVIEIQNDIASEIAREKATNGQEFLRLLWITPDLKHVSKEQAAFISGIKRNSEAQSGAEIFQNSIEDFKNLLRYEFLEKTNVAEEMAAGRLLYLIYDPIDADEVRPFKEAILKEDITVLEPAFEGDLLTVRKQHISHLRNMDGAIIFKGKVNDQWVRMKVLDLLKAPGFGRAKPIRAKGIITTGDASSLNGFRNQQLTLISGDVADSLENMKDLIKEI